MKPPKPRAFSLVEVVAALAILAGVAVFAASVQSAQSRKIAEATNLAKASQLVDPVLIELARLRDSLTPDEEPDALAALAKQIPEATDPAGLRFVAASDGTRVVAEAELEKSPLGANSGEAFYLVEVRQQSGGLKFMSGSPFLAMTLTISWPYQPRERIGGFAGTVRYNAALIR
jgi:prepilin-type N-terminal cleavage/methylation domain-containing protein